MEQEMIKRLKELLDYHKLSPSKLADDISINRSRLSHILNGRNNPTLEVIQGILNKYNDINPDWLLFGQGSMIRPGIETDPKDLFQYAEINKKKRQTTTEKEKAIITTIETSDSVAKDEVEVTSNKTIATDERPSKGHIKKIIVYFSNNEYQEFITDK